MGRGNLAFKNTFYMYIRTGVQIIVSLYSVRILLYNLGIYDYGVYSTIGSLVVMSSFITSAMSSSTQRFISYALGENDIKKLSKTICIAKKLHFVLGLFVFLFCEIIGFIFIDKYMKIPISRKYEVLIVLQFSLATFFVNVISVPYRAVLVAYERFGVLSSATILESINKLLISWIIGFFFVYSRLVTYAILFVLVTLVTFFLLFYFYSSYNSILLKEKEHDKKLFHEMVRFSGWNFFGGFGQIIANQLTTLFINIFCGPVINAAQGVANQVNGVVSRFVQDFMSAINPQITKSFSANDFTYLDKITYSSIKLSYFLIYALTIPLIFNVDFILSIWLHDIPDYVSAFIKLLLLNSCIVTLTGSISFLIEANGKIKYTQVGYAIIMALTTIVCYFLLSKGYTPNVVYYLLIISSIGCMILRLFIAHYYHLIQIGNFTIMIISKIFPLSICYFLLYYAFFHLFPLTDMVKFLTSIVLSVSFLPLYGYNVYLSEFEKSFVRSLIHKKLTI